MKEITNLDKVDWKAIYGLYRKLKETDPQHEYVLAVDELGWVIHEVRTMKNYISSNYFMENKEDRKNDWFIDESKRLGRTLLNCKRLSNRVENYAVKQVLRMLKKYDN